MALRIVVQAAAHIVRQPIVQSLSALDLVVRDFADLADVVARLNDLAPAVVIMDADGMARQWRSLAASLGGSPRGVALVLLASRFAFDDAHDAQALRVAAVIMKPWRRDEHATRILDVALARRGLRARRVVPRLPVPVSTGGGLSFSLPTGDQTVPFVNIGEGGAAVRRGPADTVLVPGWRFPTATLSWEGIRAELSFDVVHRSDEIVGVRFPALYTGRPDVVRAVQDRLARGLGAVERGRRW